MTAQPKVNAGAQPSPKPGILRIQPYVPGKSKTAAGEQALKLSSNENPLGPSPAAVAAFQAAAKKLHRYPNDVTPLHEAIAKRHGVEASRVVCGNGSDELIGLLIHAYAGPGDEVLYSRHGFLMYKVYAEGFGCTPVAAPEKDLRADVDALLAAVTERTRIVFLANPNNPTGSYITAAELKRLHQGLPGNVILAVDAAYAEYADASGYSDGRELVESAENCVMLRTFSKLYGLASLRLGWAYCPPAIADVLNRIRSPFNVSQPAVEAGIAALADTAWSEKSRAHNAQWLPWLAKEIAGLGVQVYPSAGNFLLIGFKDAAQARGAHAFLMQRGVIVRDVEAYGLPTSLRVTVGLEDENRAFIAALKDFLE